MVMNEGIWKHDFTDGCKIPLKKMGKDYTQSSKIIKKYLFQLFLMVCNVFDIKFGSSLSCHIDIFDILKHL